MGRDVVQRGQREWPVRRAPADPTPGADERASRVTQSVMPGTGKFVLLVALLLACGDSGGGDGGTDATTTAVGTTTAVPTTGDDTTTATTGAPAEWDECTQIGLEPPEVQQTAAVGIIPQAVGGAIADGTYVLSKYEVFGATGLTSDTLSGALTFSSPAFQLRTLDDTAHGTFTTAGSDLTRTVECACSRALAACEMSTQTPTTHPYSAFDDTLLVFSDYINGGTALATYIKQ